MIELNLISVCSRKGRVLIKTSYSSPLRLLANVLWKTVRERFPKYLWKLLMPATWKPIFIPWGPFLSWACRDKAIKAPANVHSIFKLAVKFWLPWIPNSEFKVYQQCLMNLKFYNSLIYSIICTWNRSQRIMYLFATQQNKMYLHLF